MSFNIFRRSSIRKSLMIMLLLTSSVTVAIAAIGFAVNDWMSLRQSMYDQLNAQAGIAGSNIVAALTFNDPEAARQTLLNFSSENEIAAALLFNHDDKLFAEYRRDGEQIPETLPSEERGAIGRDLFVRRPVMMQGEQLGHIVLIADLSYWHDRQMGHIAMGFSIFLMALGVSYLVALRLQRVVTQPIVDLATTARNITQGKDYRLRAAKISRDEIGRLVDDFNTMLDQIQLRDHELSHAREELEEKVQERTAELTELTRLLEHQAFHDTLTGLANRSTFDDHLRLAIHQSQRYGGQVAVLFLDLDRFKIINDTLGHMVGDKLLVRVANRFRACVRDSDTLARLGGDEFAVLLYQGQNEHTASEVAQKLINEINRPVQIDGYNLHITTSIGISLFPHDGDSAETILKNADTAMYQSKDRGRNQFTFFAEEMNSRALRRLDLETKLRKAISRREFQIFYQPRLDTFTLELIGAEALIRWFEPSEGEIQPSEFIPLAEECGLISQIDDWVMENACNQILDCFEGEEPTLTLSLNLSTNQFIRKDLDSVIAGVLRRTGYPGHRLEFEITENLFGPESANVTELLQNIRELGVEISIDDFGKAYSSLSRLKQLPLQTLKIDRTFVLDVGKDPDDEVLVVTIITMAHSLGLKVVAEGIETRAQYDFVKAHNCDAVQGFLFGRPLPLVEFKRQWLTKQPTQA